MWEPVSVCVTPGRLEHLLSGISVRMRYCGFRSAGGRLLWSQSVCVCVCKGGMKSVCLRVKQHVNTVEETLMSIREIKKEKKKGLEQGGE